MSIVIQLQYNTFTGFLNLNEIMQTYLNTGEFNSNLSGFVTTYGWFKLNRHNLTNLGKDEEPTYSQSTPFCHLKLSNLGPISVNKTELKMEWVEQQIPEIQSGGFYAPNDCQPRHRVAILVPFRDREINLIIFLNHMHRFLMKQLLLYRIFVVEQFGQSKFNKGSLYNVAYIISQRFGHWHCLIFHDVDLLPLNGKILYTCPRQPTHMSPSVENLGYRLPYNELFGGVTTLTPKQFESVNGYSNNYWNWGAEDDDMFIRLQARRYSILRYSKSIGRYASLPHDHKGRYNCAKQVSFTSYKLGSAKKRYRREGLSSLKFVVIKIIKKKLYTHILANINLKQ